MQPRREFLKTGLALGATVSFLDLGNAFAAEHTATVTSAPEAAATGSAGARPILVAVRDGDRVAMLDKALESLGGIGAFVKPGQSVLIKPNIGWDAPPERGANTHPALVGRLVELCLAAGAKSVSIFDNTCDQWQRCYENSGIEKAARDAGAKIVNGKDETLYRETAIPNGVKLKSAKVHELVLDSDVFINVPVLKHHGGAQMSSAMKNLMGCVWDRGVYHRVDLQQTIADFLTLRKPDLNIVDAYHPMVRNGPRGKSVEDCVEMKRLLVSADPVLIDAACTKLLGYTTDKVSHVKLGADLNLGTLDLSGADVRSIKLA
ncbi:MAG TPA: DUF362 domain-containing protein [Opitutaceae bacterium]|nr:DUF362 domain-containing protein [Opitutaceae bacterium]